MRRTCDKNNHLRDSLSKIFSGTVPCFDKEVKYLKASWIKSPLGDMIAIADDEALWRLDFADRKNISCDIEHLNKSANAIIRFEKNTLLDLVEEQLEAFFLGQLKNFKIPVHFRGTDFQQSAWKILAKIPYGETRSYRDQAEALYKPSAYRAVANANGANACSVIIPCHRIINHNGQLGGYGGGLFRKVWLLNHEKKHHELGME